MANNPSLQDWRDKTVWIVGASSGIGLALAKALHAAGARVVLSARKAELLQEFVQTHRGCMALPLDVQDAAALRAAVAELLMHHRQLDACIYCAGHYQNMRAQQFSLDQALRHIHTNYVGALNFLDAVLPQLLRQAKAGKGGHISLVSSVAAYRALPKAMAYGPSKAALTHLAESLYLDLASEGLGVSVVHPGFVATPLTVGNDFNMPALISPEQAAQAIMHGWAAGRFEIHFPKRFTRWLKFMRLLPYGLYFRVVHRVTGL
ncbi:SDR family NAD(P)-dependent oxidoreductase [Variovorax sp. HJSM1_2]|uniref:SDR family NAD(P)-dependent oxidoreductase n=1 Tax=Variovorax sp. HJSM1_2 TaxID=3366263 RepID=UPI003BC21D22